MNPLVNPVRKLNTPFVCFIIINIIIIISGGFLTFLFAQPLERIEITSSPNPVGSGARALGMGGAFIAVANDATAASWNPAGLFHLQLPEISFVGDAFYRIENNEFGTNPEACGAQSLTKNSINYLSVAIPFNLWRRNMIVSVNYQNLYDFNRKWKFPLVMDSEGLTAIQNVDYQQNGNLSALGIAYSIEVTPEFSLGLTLNIWDDGLCRNGWERKSFQWGSGINEGNAFSFESRSLDRYSFKGLNINLGTQWQLFNDKLTIGAVLKTPFRADLKRESTCDTTLHYPEYPEADANSAVLFTGDETLDMPLSFGVGFAYRFFSGFTASLDIYRTEWEEFILTDSKGNQTSSISGRVISASHIDPTFQIRIGAEYIIITPKYEVPLRAGIFYDPAPAEGRPDDYFGFSVGSGIKLGRSDFDIAYQYRFGENVGASILQNLNFTQDVDEHTVYFSLIYHFGKRYFF